MAATLAPGSSACSVATERASDDVSRSEGDCSARLTSARASRAPPRASQNVYTAARQSAAHAATGGGGVLPAAEAEAEEARQGRTSGAAAAARRRGAGR
jgi:hypothetical protein